MSLSIIPAIFFVTLMILSSVDKAPDQKQDKTWGVKKMFSTKKPIGMLERKESDRNTIYSYIRKKYKKISGDDAKEIADNLVDYGKKYNVDPKFAAAVIARESAFKKDAVSVTGAKGLGQIKDFNYKDLKITDPFNINQNIDGTVHYLKKMIKKWHNNKDDIAINKKAAGDSTERKPVAKEDHLKLALASYFKGFTAVKETGVDPKTKKYVDDILRYYHDIVDSEVPSEAPSEAPSESRVE